jgi:ketosteroid isomerase-like protein
MGHRDTEVIKLFNDAFLDRDAAKLVDLVADDCIMESTQPAPNGTRYEGYDACVRFWQELIADPEGSFEPEDVLVSGDRATIRWRYRFGDGEENTVRGVNLMHVRDGKIVEALGYVKAGLQSSAAASPSSSLDIATAVGITPKTTSLTHSSERSSGQQTGSKRLKSASVNHAV